MRVLAFDPGASLGFCLMENGAYIDGGSEEFVYPTPAQQRKGIAKGRKWWQLGEFISSTIQQYQPEFIFVEDVKRHSSVLAAHSFGFIFHTIEAFAYGETIPFYSIGVGVWKKLATGSGNADKDLILSAMQARFTGVSFLTHDHSDACGIAFAASTMILEGRLSELVASAGGKKKAA